MPTIHSQAPVLLQVVGDSYTVPCRIMAVIWEGTTTSGNTCEIKDKITGELLWAGRTEATETYLGANFSQFNIGCQGFVLTKLSAGRVLVYLANTL